MMTSSSEEDEPELETLNISNDEYYQAPKDRELWKQLHLSHQKIRDEIKIKTLQKLSTDHSSSSIPKYGSTTIRHSMPAYDLWRFFFPTSLSVDKYRNFHRPKLRHFKTGPQAMSRDRGPVREFPIKNLTKTIYRAQTRLRFKVMGAIDRGIPRDIIINKLLLINKAKDLTAKHGELFLFEYCEEYPPVLSQVGMASNIKIYSLPSNQERPRQVSLPNETNTHSSENQLKSEAANQVGFNAKISNAAKAQKIYFSQPKPGATFKVIENNMYRAPIYEQKFSGCDFLIIRTRNSLYIRPLATIFTVGQTMPFVPIPPPTESNIQKFRFELSNIHIHRLFRESDTESPSMSLDHIAKLFPDYHLAILKRRMKKSRAVRSSSSKHFFENIYLRGDSNYGLVSQLDIRKSLLPEQYCLNMAMLAARHRLRELNYSESMIIPSNDAELEIEVLAAPWNTSKAIAETLRGKSYLDLERHLIDPTGPQREGYSCVVWSKSPTEDQQAKDMKSDSRGPNTLPFTFQEKNPLAYKIRTEKLERMEIFKKKADIIAQVQARVLSSDLPISSSEDESDDNDDSENINDDIFEQQLKDLDKLLVGGRTICELNHENEEEERRKLLVEMRANGSSNQSDETPKTDSFASGGRPISQDRKQTPDNFSQPINLSAIKNKILRITRTYQTPEGNIQRTELVREPRIIALYVKERQRSLKSSQTIVNDSEMTLGNANDNLGHTILSTKSAKDTAHRRGSYSRASLGPSELCRADGTTLTISKKVLQHIRPSRRLRQNSSTS